MHQLEPKLPDVVLRGGEELSKTTTALTDLAWLSEKDGNERYYMNGGNARSVGYREKDGVKGFGKPPSPFPELETRSPTLASPSTSPQHRNDTWNSVNLAANQEQEPQKYKALPALFQESESRSPALLSLPSSPSPQQRAATWNSGEAKELHTSLPRPQIGSPVSELGVANTPSELGVMSPISELGGGDGSPLVRMNAHETWGNRGAVELSSEEARVEMDSGVQGGGKGRYYANAGARV